jgi:hypothetical protein
MNINTISWTDLNDLLRNCKDLRQLSQWLETAVKDGVISRVVRIYGRLSAVRRAGELRELKAKVMEAQKRSAS